MQDIYIQNKPLAEALDLWQKALKSIDFPALTTEEIPVDDALNRTTAAPVFAKFSSPFYNASAMDGIAVRFAETIEARENNAVKLGKEQFIKVNTGNLVPEEFNAVIMIEDVHFTPEGQAEIIAAATPWQHIRTIGEDIVATELILPEGHLVRPIDMGAMLATGITQIMVRQIPVVQVIPTGSDVVQPGAEKSPGNIIEFNSRILAGYLADWGAKAEKSPIIEDDPGKIKAAILAGAAKYDLVIINAGASAGEKDFTAEVLAEIGQIIVHGVNIKPGKPVILAIVNGTPVVGLPGYPVSAVLTLRLFVMDMINQALGRQREKPELVKATLSRPLSSKMGVEDFVRIKLGQVGENLMATPISRGAGAVMSMVQADGILTVPAGSEGIGASETVEVELLRPLQEVYNTIVFIGSHDNILDVLANLLHKQTPIIRLSSAHVGSMGGIMAIRRGEAHIAGTHLLDEESGEYNVPFIRQYLKEIPLELINLAFREQGLLVPKGNPKNIEGFHDLQRKEISFINRQRGAGTRILCDIHLKNLAISPAQVNGYDREEYTHMNIASAVASGSADTGLAIKAAARALNLDFIPVAQERYDIIVPLSLKNDERVTTLLRLIRHDPHFKKSVEDLGGYDLRESGKVMYKQ